MALITIKSLNISADDMHDIIASIKWCSFCGNRTERYCKKLSDGKLICSQCYNINDDNNSI